MTQANTGRKPRTVRVWIGGAGGMAMGREVLQSLYASDLAFEPDERRQTILPDGTVEMQVTREPYMLHARLRLPLYGSIWVMADNEGKGYEGEFVDFVTEAIRTYLAETRRLARELEQLVREALPTEVRAHWLAAEEYAHLANRGKDTPENRLYALSHAVYAAEGALLSLSRRRLAAAPRRDLRLGCNFFKYGSPNDRYAKYFRQLFDYATLPFYPRDTVPEQGVYRYDYIEHALEFLGENKIAPKGHPLWFGHDEVNPAWLKGLPFDELRLRAGEIARHHVGTFRGRIGVWDAMNEAHDWANCFELNHAQLTELTRTCCEAVREADPGAQSIVNVCLPFAEYVAGRYNCYGPLPERLWSPLAYLRRMIAEGVDFDITGVQLYFPARDMIAVSRLLDVFLSLGKPVHITEMGVNGGLRAAGSGAGRSQWSQLDMSEGTWHGGWNERTQAEWMETFYTIAAAKPNITALTWWDFIEPSFSGNGAFLYEDGNPREMLFRLQAWKERYAGTIL